MKKKGVVKGVALSETQEQKEEEALLKGRRGGRGWGAAEVTTDAKGQIPQSVEGE